ncbi:hypothetical protein G6F46_006348 [Rhizopus delemar]|nr:hypothetical protein G6F46_006348 [Rhizopus delemar]
MKFHFLLDGSPNFKRIGVKCRPMHGESASVDITSENIQNELRKIEELLGSCDPADIMNFDETGLYYQQPPRRTMFRVA